MAPKIYGLCVVKNEDDIVAQSLTCAAGHCERVFVIDNGSTDATWDIVRGLAETQPKIVPFERIEEPFHNGLRARVYNALHRELSETDWWQLVDADEFLAEDPGAAIGEALTQGAHVINAWQIQFYFTERDLQDWESGEDSRERPIAERRRYYTINWQEGRLFRNDPRRSWNGESRNAIPDWLTRVSRRRIMNRHYQYRDPEQIEKRLRLRYGHGQFQHVRTLDWRDVMRESRHLTKHVDGAPWRFSLSGVGYFYRRNLAMRLKSAYHGGARRRLQRMLSFS